MFSSAASDQEAFCFTCHDGTAATTDVKDGVSTASTNANNKALRGGGFEKALLNTAGAVRGNPYWNASSASYRLSKFGDPKLASADGTISIAKIPALAAGVAVTSTHTLGEGTMWGAGISGAGAKVDLECTSCHNPHGNGNFRILQEPASIGSIVGAANAVNVMAQYAAVSAVTWDTDAHAAGKVVITYTVAKNTFFPGMNVRILDPAKTDGTALTTGVVSSVTTTSFSIAGASAPTYAKGALATVATVSYPTTIVSAVADGAAVKYTTAANHGLWKGQVISLLTMDGKATPLAVQDAVITSVPALNSFTVASTQAAASVGGTALLYIPGIPDAVGTTDTTGPGVPVGVTGYKKVYTTDNFYTPDDHYYSGAYQANASYKDATGATITYSGLKNGFIQNVSQWCATCHTRYIAQGTSRSYANSINGTVDPQFTYRHTSASAGEGSPNCIQCHVAHGTNAAMTGTYSSAVTVPGGAASNGSRLLRFDNRGLCAGCHQP